MDGRLNVPSRNGTKGNRAVLTAMCSHELLTAALDLRKPHFAFFDAPEIIALSENPMLNILTFPVDEQRGWALPSLLAHGLTKQALRVMLDLQHISVIIEAYTQGALQNPEVLALTSRRNSIHHALLSLPAMDEVEVLTEDQKSVYESCRVAALIYDLSIIFPVPSSTGVIAKLVANAKVVLETMRLEIVLGASAKVLTWVLFMAGAAAESMYERPWFVEKLKLVLVSEAICHWDSVREILNSYLWMSSAMDNAAVRLWDEISMAS
jgi:hypothetical protein